MVIDRRFLIEEDLAEVKGEVHAILERLRRERAGFRYAMRDLMEVQPVLADRGLPVPQAVARRSGRCSGARPQLVCSPGTYDQKHIARIGHLHDCVAYGPGILDLAHQPDEFVAIDDLVASAKVMALATLQLLGVRGVIRPGPRNSLTDVAGLLGRQCRGSRGAHRRHRGAGRAGRCWPPPTCGAARPAPINTDALRPAA